MFDSALCAEYRHNNIAPVMKATPGVFALSAGWSICDNIFLDADGDGRLRVCNSWTQRIEAEQTEMG